MRKLLLALCFIASTANAQSELSATFTISDLSLGGDITIDILELDINFGDRYLALNGAIIFSTGVSAPVTGTCINSAGGGVFCNLQVDLLSFNISLNAVGVGTISVKGTDGSTVDDGVIALDF